MLRICRHKDATLARCFARRAFIDYSDMRPARRAAEVARECYAGDRREMARARACAYAMHAARSAAMRCAARYVRLMLIDTICHAFHYDADAIAFFFHVYADYVVFARLC